MLCGMGRGFLENAFIIWLFLVAGSSADTTCKKGCSKADNSILKYVPGFVYEYKFDSVMSLAVETGSTTDDNTLQISGTAKLFAEGNCGYTLQLNGVKILAAKENIEKRLTSIIQKPVYFTMINGKVDPQICTDSNENTNSLNIKRAIISLIQTTTIERDHEIDVFGQCPTFTTSINSGVSTIITKVRNLNNCRYRENFSNAILNGIINDSAGIKSTSTLNADFSKESKISNGILENVQAVEIYNYGGPSKTNLGVSAKVVTVLKLKNLAGTKAAAPPTSANGVSIIYEKADPHVSQNIGVLKKVFEEVVQLTSDYAHQDSAKAFIDLIRLMRSASMNSLLELSKVPHPNKIHARKVYLDALFRTGTTESAKATIKQIAKMNESEKRLAILSLNLVEKVDKETVSMATELLFSDVPNEIYLSLGNLVSKYCKAYKCDGKEIDLISKKIGENLKHCKPNSKTDEDKIIYVLKGIGNSLAIAKRNLQILTECADVGRPNRIRVAALKVFATISCENIIQNKALHLLKDRNEDSEIRIQAYLALIECPMPSVANTISEVVNSEPVNQVGGFIASNLAAIRDSTDSHRENQKHNLGNIRVTKKFPKDFRRYSFNNELSYKFDAAGISASADYKLIYSQRGFLPRSAHFNFTAELFGTNFNVFDANIRQENLENLLEHFMGPKGLFNKNLDDIIKAIESGDESSSKRRRRSIIDDAEKISKKYRTYGGKTANELNFDLSLKLFGTELFFLSLGDNIPGSIHEIIKQLSNALDNSKKGISAFKKEFVAHSLFLDIDFTYPTSAGISFELTAEGFAANKIELGVNVDVDAILEQNFQDAKLQLKLVPSFDIIGNLKAGFNAAVLTTGIKISASVQSATGSNVEFIITKEGNEFNLNIDLPRNKLELINLSTTADFYIGETDRTIREIEIKKSMKNKDGLSSMCFTQLDSFGFNLCFEYSPLSNDKKNSLLGYVLSPVRYGIYLNSEQHINIKGIHTPKTKKDTQKWELLFSTPVAANKHDASLAFEFGTIPHIFARVSVDSAQCHYGVQIGINNDEKELVLYGKYEQDSSVMNSKVGFLKNGNEYNPIIEINEFHRTVDTINGYKADGKVIVQQINENESKYEFQTLRIFNEQNDEIIINGWLTLGAIFFDSEIDIQLDKEEYKIQSGLKIENGLYEAKLFVADPKEIDGTIGVSVHFEIKQDNLIVAASGKGFFWDVDSLTEISYSKQNENNGFTSNDFKNELSIRYKKDEVLALNVTGSTDGLNKFNFIGEITCGNNEVAITIDLLQNQKSEYDYSLKLYGKLNKHFVNLVSYLEFNGNHYILNNAITTSSGFTTTIKGEFGQRYSLQDILIDLHGTIQISEKDKINHFTVKIVGYPEKTNNEFKMMSENSEIVKLTGDILHPQDKITSIKLNFNVKNVLTFKADFKVAKNGRGEVTSTIELLKVQENRKLELLSKFHIQSPKFDLETTFNFGEHHKILFKTENTIDKSKIASKNILDIDGKKNSIDLNVFLKGDWKMNGEINSNLKLSLANGRSFDGSLKRRITTSQKTGISQGNIEIYLNDLLSSDKKRSLQIKGKADKVNFKNKDFATEINVIFSDYNDKKVQIENTFKLLPKGIHKFLEFSLKTTGDYIQKPIEIEINVEELSSKHAVGHLNAKYADLISGQFNVVCNINYPDLPTTFELSSKVNVPNSNWKSLDIITNFKILKDVSEHKSYKVELDFDERTGQGQFLKLNTLLNWSPQAGNLNMNIQSNDLTKPMVLVYHYSKELAKVDHAFGNKQNITFSVNDHFIKNSWEIRIDSIKNLFFTIDFESSFESLRRLESVIQSSRDENENHELKLNLRSNDQHYAFVLDCFHSTHKKGFDLKITLPDNEPIVITNVAEFYVNRRTKFSSNIRNLMDLDLTIDADTLFTSIDDFFVLAKLNSNKLKLYNYELDVHTEQSSLQISVKNKDGVVFSGSTKYTLRAETNKSIIEGQGQLQYMGKTQNLNFRIIRQTFLMDSDNELGFSYTLNANMGIKNAVATYKATNKEVNTQFSLCEEKKQCTNLQFQSMVEKNENSFSDLVHSVLILLDLRELGYPYEFDFLSKTVKNGVKYQYNLESSIISNNNLKYQLLANVLPTSSTALLKLPSREIALETISKMPPLGTIFGEYEAAFKFYIDKMNKPNDILSFTSKCIIGNEEFNTFQMRSLLQVTHPKIRTLTVTGSLEAKRDVPSMTALLEFDTFQNSDQKIILTSELQNLNTNNGFNITVTNKINSSGLGFNYKLSGHTGLDLADKKYSTAVSIERNNNKQVNFHLVGCDNQIQSTFYITDIPIFKFNGKSNKKESKYHMEAMFQLFNKNPLNIEGNVDSSGIEFSVNSANHIYIKGDTLFGKQVGIVLKENGKILLEGRISLEAATFLKASHSLEEEDLKNLLESLQGHRKLKFMENVDSIIGNIKDSTQKKLEFFKQTAPDFQELRNDYENSLHDIIKELEVDPAFNQLANAYKNLLNKILSMLSDFSNFIQEAFEKVENILYTVRDQIIHVYNDCIATYVEEIYLTVENLCEKLYSFMVKLTINGFKSIVNIFEMYSGVIGKYSQTLHEILGPFNEMFGDLLKTTETIIVHLSEVLKVFLEKLPSAEDFKSIIKQKISSVRIVEKIVVFIENLFEKLNLLPVSSETSQLLEKLQQYLIAKIKNEPIDETSLLKDIFDKVTLMLRSILSNMDNSIPALPTSIHENINKILTILSNFVNSAKTLPSILTLRLSTLNYLLNEDWQNIFTKDVFNSWPFFKSFTLSGQIVEGKHIFTFDGLHFPFIGNCKYILAQDSVDNNFTVFAQLNNGKLKSIILTDRGNNFVELGETGAIKMNGTPVESPYYDSGIHAIRRYYTTRINSEYGVSIMCTSGLKVCHVNLNGFYTSKVRGLFGNGNAEQYDDYIQIDGKIANNIGEFVNNYGIGKCPPANIMQAVDTHSEICTEIFSMDSTLIWGFYTLDPKPYRKACDEAVNSSVDKDKELNACTFALAYGSALRFLDTFVMLPARCLKCTGSSSQKDLASEFSVKIPNNKADVVFVVDMDVSEQVLQNLVSPIVNDFREALKSRGFTDIQIGVIVYTKNQKYPALVTNDNGKVNYNGNIAEIKLNGPSKFNIGELRQILSDSKMLGIIENIEQFIKGIMPQSDEAAYKLAIEYPFRAAAAKTIIGIRSDIMSNKNLLKNIRANMAEMLKYDSALIHLIGPVNKLSVDGIPTEKIIGFNSKVIATLDGKDNKKRQKLQFENNMGIDFVLNNNGWVFNTQNFDNIKPIDQKKMVGHVVNTIADILFKTEVAADCICLPIHGLHAQHFCSAKSSAFVPNKKIKIA